jgi:hypothetical protein
LWEKKIEGGRKKRQQASKSRTNTEANKLPHKQAPSPTMASHWDRLPADIQVKIEEMAYTALMGDVMKFIPLLKCDDLQAAYMEVVRNREIADYDRRSNKVFKVGMDVEYVNEEGVTFTGKVKKINRKYIDVIFERRNEYGFGGWKNIYKLLPSQLQMA